jgi:hypothetical protein
MGIWQGVFGIFRAGLEDLMDVESLRARDTVSGRLKMGSYS